MNCKETIYNLSAYIDRMLDKDAEAAVERHIHECPNCAKELETLKACVEKLRALPRKQAPADFLKSVHARIDEPPFWSAFFSFPRIKIPLELAGLVATLLLIVFFSKDMIKETRQTAFNAILSQSGPKGEAGLGAAHETAPVYKEGNPADKEQQVTAVTARSITSEVSAEDTAKAAPSSMAATRAKQSVNLLKSDAGRAEPVSSRYMFERKAANVKKEPAPAVTADAITLAAPSAAAPARKSEMALKDELRGTEVLQEQSYNIGSAAREKTAGRAMYGTAASKQASIPPAKVSTPNIRVAAKDKVTETTLRDITVAVEKLNGEVTSSNLKGPSGARLEIRIPVKSYPELLALLKRYGTIAGTPSLPNQNALTIDVTVEITR